MTKTKYRLLFALMSIVLVSIIGLCFSVGNYAKADAFRIEGTALQDEYVTGTTIDVPDLYFTVSGGEVKAQKTIIFPSGNAYDKDELILSEMGLYKVEYTAKNGSDVLFAEDEFYVTKPYFETVGTEFSSVEYKAYELTPNYKALNVQLDSKSKLVCNEIINVNELGANNKLISLYMTPDQPGNCEFSQLVITLTDVYDKNNFVQVIANASTDGIRHGVAYVLAGATSQRAGGWQGEVFNSGGTYGTATRFNFWSVNYYGLGQGDGTYSEEYLVNNKFQVFFDYAEKKMQTLDHSTGNKTLISDLDDPATFSNVWKGFKTGEAYLSIQANNITGTYANFAIDYLAGKPLNLDLIRDSEAPKITVDLEGATPLAVKGVPYKVFDVEAFDRIDFERPVNVRVFKDNGTNPHTELNIVDGKFTPKTAGNYYIEYSATDCSGNKGVQRVNVTCVEQTEQFKILIDEGSKNTSIVTGEVVQIASATVLGGAGGAELKIVVTDASGKEIEIEDGEFRPEVAGEYTVTYSAVDYVMQTASSSYVISVTNSQSPIFQEQPTFLKYYIAGREYVLPEYVAFDYSSGTQTKVNVQIIVDDEGETRTLNSDRKVTFEVASVGTATITYKASESVYKTFTVGVRNVDYDPAGIDMSKYFAVLEGDVKSELVSNGKDSTVVLLTANENGKFEFINTVLTNKFEMEFSVVSSKANFDKFTVTLTDSVDSSKVLKLIYRSVSDETAMFSINGGTEYNVGTGFTHSGNTYKVVLNESVGKVSGNGSVFYPINKFSDGEDFDRFPSGKAYLTIAFENVTAESSVYVGMINSQPMQGIIFDRVAPNVVVYEADDSTKQIGDDIVIKPAIAGDVVDQCPSLLLNVKSPSGSFVTDKNGTLLKDVSADREYVINLSEYGTYRINYTTEDFTGRNYTYSIIITIRDTIVPEITLEKENVTTAKLGQKVTIEKATYSDNISQADKLKIMTFIVTPDGRALKVEQDSFIVSQVGTYGIRYMAYDEDGNLAIKEDKIVVEEEQTKEGCGNNASFLSGGAMVVLPLALFAVVVMIKRRKEV